MQIRNFLERLAQLNLSLIVRGGELILKGNKDKLSAEEVGLIRENKEIIDFIRENKAALIQHLLETSKAAVYRKRSDNIDSLYPLSVLQEGMLFHSLDKGKGGAYINHFVCTLEHLELEPFKMAWQHLIHRHTILRTAFYYEEFSLLLQGVFKEADLPVREYDLTGFTKEEQDAKLAAFLQEDRGKGFDLSQPPLLRVSLFKIEEDKYQMVWLYHHILTDGWSIPIMINELLSTYSQLIDGNMPKVAITDIDAYEDYIKYLDQIDRDKAKSFWQEYLKGVEQGSLLPFVPSGQHRNYGGASVQKTQLELDAATLKAVQACANENEITVNTLLQGVWSYLLAHYTNRSEAIFGVTVSGRPVELENAEQRVGLYINTIPLCTKLQKDIQITDWLVDIQDQHSQARAYQHGGLRAIQDWNSITGTLFDSILVFQNYPVGKELGKDIPLEISAVEVDERTNYLLTLVVALREQLTVNFIYNDELLGADFIEMIKRQFKETLLEILHKVDGALGDINLDEKTSIPGHGESEIVYPYPSVLEQFKAQVETTPEAIAIRSEEEECSYFQLEERSNQMARFLLDAGLKTEDRVGLCLDRSIDLIVAILGIQKAGGAFVPLDSDLPEPRIRYMIEQSQAAYVISAGDHITLFSDHSGTSVIDLDHAQMMLEAYPTTELEKPVSTAQLAYVLYTSGSTGQPKGVAIEHRNLNNYLSWAKDTYGGNEPINMGLYSSISFDLTITSIYLPLLTGGKTIIYNKGAKEDRVSIVDVFENNEINVLKLTPSHLRLIESTATAGDALRCLIVGGEALPTSLAASLYERYSGKIRIINEYGPTETTVGSTYHEFNPALDQLDYVPIGQPIANTVVRVLDEEGRLVGAGGTGELFIGGAGVARAYLFKPELTADRFVTARSDSDNRLYRTGDLVRWLPNGALDFIGRMDNQVKVRSYRIELGEIEVALQGNELVSDCVVSTQKDTEGVLQLVAYVVADETLEPVALSQFLATKLPHYMIPSQWMQIEEIPLAKSGKVDRKSLPVIESTTLLRQKYNEPSTSTEIAVAKIWSKLLAIDRVGRYDSFFDLGGHSLLAIRVLAAIHKELDIEIGIDSIFSYPLLGDFAAFLDTQRKGASLPPITKQARENHIPLSFSQERLWFIDQLEGSTHYHMPSVLRLEGDLNPAVLQEAFAEIINRHEVLRTVYYQQKGIGYQQMLTADQWQMPLLSTADFMNGHSWEAALSNFVNQPFDLANDYMLRAILVQRTPDEHVLVMVLHHIASDGWSMAILVDELVELYRAKMAKRVPNLEALDIQYADYAIWQRKYLTDELMAEKLAWWEGQLKGVEPLDLPTDFPRPAIQSTRGARSRFQLDKDISEQVRNLSKETGTTLFMTLLSVFKVLMYRYSGQSDICVGTPVANRPQKEVEPLMGFFLNNLALRTDLDGNPAFDQLLAKIKEDTLEAYARQEVAFEQVVDKVYPERDQSRSPLFQVVLVLNNTPTAKEIDLDGLTLCPEQPGSVSSTLDLHVMVEDREEGLSYVMTYGPDLFLPETIERMGFHFEQLLRAIVRNPKEKIADLPMLSAAEKTQLLEEFNNTDAPVLNETVVDLIIDQANTQPDAIAIQFEDQVITYQQLDERSNQVAHLLQEQGVTKGTMVLLCLERSVELIVGMLGILKAGGVYVPVDPEAPAERIEYILADCLAPVALSQSDLVDKLPSNEALQVLLLDQVDIASLSTARPTQLPTPKDLCYVIYTSGSTGKPKGVLIEHAGLSNMIYYQVERFGLGTKDKVLQFASVSFDGAAYEIYIALVAGSTLVIPTKEAILSAEEMQTLLQEINFAALPTSYQQFVEAGLHHLDTLISAGEALDPTLTQQLINEGVKVVNGYGPTESTIGVAESEDPIDEFGKVSMGTPLPNTKVHILDEFGQLVPIGVKGEICIEGMQIARGYLNRPELSQQKFGTTENGQRLYHTGDLARRRLDGSIEFSGRADHQVKIRGNRIELGEIEKATTAIFGVTSCVVLAKQDDKGQKFLSGYIVLEDNKPLEEINKELRASLPDYMVPAVWMKLQTLPLLDNGKVDRKALEKLELAPTQSKKQTVPTSRYEKILAQIWADLLEIEEVGVQDNFFDLGGHSLLAVRVIVAIKEAANIDLDIQSVFKYPVLEDFAAYLGEQSVEEEISNIGQQLRPDLIPLSFSQERLWFIDQLEGSIHYHVPMVLRLLGDLDKPVFDYAFQEIIARHEILRTVYLQQEGRPYQQILAPQQWAINWRRQADFGSKQAWEHWLEEEIKRPFDLTKDFPIRVHMLERSEKEHVLVLILHHIASDGWSNAILIDELAELYRAKQVGRATILSPLPTQYADYAIWQRQEFRPEILEGMLDWWAGKLTDTEPLDMPTDFPRPAIQSTKGARYSRRYNLDLLNQLKALSQQSGTTLFMTLLAGFKVLLYRYTGQTDICIGTPVANRTQKDIEPLIGFFLNNLALRTDLSGNPSFADLLDAVKEDALEAFSRQEVPFEQVVERVDPVRDQSRSPLFQVVFMYNNTPAASKVELDGLEFRSEESDLIHSTVDLHINMEEYADGLGIKLTYCQDLFNSDTIQRLLQHFEQLLWAIVQHPTEKIGQLKMLSPAEEHQLIYAFNDTAKAFPERQTVLDLFQACVQETPQATAIKFQEQSLSYETLDALSNQLAHYLQQKGLVKGSLVAVCMDRSINMIVAILGIIKSGGVYVPIDPAYPEFRINYMMRDSGALLVLSDEANESLFKADPAVALVNLDALELIESAEQCSTNLQAADLAYVIYTSGSTGQPKGVLIEHGGLANLMFNQMETMPLGTNTQVLQFSSVSFDAAAYEIFVALCTGSTLVIPDKNTILSSEKMGVLLKEIDFATLPTSYQQFVEPYLTNLKTLVSVGEAMDSQLALRLQEAGVQVYNGYGPTENTVAASISLQPITADGKVSIGHPFRNVATYIFDENGNLAPIGVIGELYIGGAQVARGYLNQVEKTHEQFKQYDLGKLYRSGDLARRLSDGSLEFIGRRDDQVKLRGYRIELGEIEQAILQLDSVHSCTVLLTTDEQSNQQLTAYLVPESAMDLEEMVLKLKQQLPEYMIPTHWNLLESMPLLANGKVDKQELSKLANSKVEGKTYTEPESHTAKAIANIWKELLGIDTVGMEDSFFDLGGHSLLAVRVIVAIQEALQVELDIESIFSYPSLRELSGFVDTQHTGSGLPPITATPHADEDVPLSFAQERLWFVDQLEGSVQYHMPSVLRLKGQLDVSALASAFKELVERHEVLRTVFDQRQGEAFQRIRSAEDWSLSQYQQETFGDETAFSAWLEAEQLRPFDLTQDYMLRAHLIKVAEEDHILLMILHHIVADGWSMGILIKEVTELYQAQLSNQLPTLPILPIQYADYTIWQRQNLTDAVLAEKLNWWEEQLKGVTPLHLPLDFERPALHSTKGEVLEFEVDAALMHDLKQLAKDHGATLFMTMLAIFKVLLYRHSGQPDICVGTPIGNRQQKEIEPLIGFFLNNLALRSDLSANPSFEEFLSQVKKSTLDAYAHQEVPFEQVVDRVDPERDLSRSPLFQVVFGLNNVPPSAKVEMEDLILYSEKGGAISATVDLHLMVHESEEGLSIGMTYGKELFKPETMLRFRHHFEQLMRSVVANPRTSLLELPMLSEVEKSEILNQFSGETKTLSNYNTVLAMIEEQFAKQADTIALQYQDQQLTYRQLEEKSNKIAHYLMEQGARSNVLIGLCVDRSIDMIVGILGILKAGAAYVPIDPNYPQERKEFLLKDSASGLVLVDEANHTSIAETPDRKVVNLSNYETTFAHYPTDTPARKLTSEDLAYMIYTSGSTGRPKGVLIEHRGLLNLSLNQIKAFGLTEGTKMLQFASISFDASCSEIFTALASGSQLIIPESDTLLSAQRLGDLIATQKIEVATLPPSYQISMEEQLWGLRTLVSAGEPLNVAITQRLQEKGVRVINAYGPTENTVCVTLTDEPISNSRQASIGQPLTNVQAFVLNDANRLSPIGVEGELFVGGEQLARGYLNQVELTQERFTKDPFNPGKRLYQTGDQVSWMPDGNLAYLGRRDEQVKIRGYRIELGEIEHVLRAAPNVLDCAVIAQKENGVYRLYAFVVPLPTAQEVSWSDYLAERLPSYMLPAQWQELEVLPLTNSGKVDKKALLAAASGQDHATYVAPSTEVERKLAAIWMDLLGLEKVGIHDNFFELGGDSIISIQAVSRAHHEGLEFQVADMFENQTIAELVNVLKVGSANVKTEEGLLSGEVPLLPIQQWFFDTEHPVHNHYNQALLLQLDKSITVEQLDALVTAIVEQHDCLRMSYAMNEGHWIQSYNTSINEGLRVDDLKAVASDKLMASISACCDRYQRSLDIEAGQLYRFVLLKTPEAEQSNRLFMVIHHLAVDGVSWRILLDDLQRALEQLKQGQAIDLGPKGSSYRQWHQALYDFASSPWVSEQTEYWTNIVAGYRPLPVDKAPDAISAKKDLFVYKTSLPTDLTKHLVMNANRAYNTEINDLLLSALAKTIGQWAGVQQLVIGMEGHGRESISEEVDVSRTIGWFTNLYPTSLSCGQGMPEGQLIKTVKEQLRQIPDKGMGYSALKYLHPDPTIRQRLALKQPWDIVFNYLGQFDNAIKNDGLGGAAENPGEMVAEENRFGSRLEINASVNGGELALAFSYSGLQYQESTIATLAARYLDTLSDLIQHCVNKQSTEHTPSDFGLQDKVSNKQLEAFLEIEEEGAESDDDFLFV
ncbi:MAG: amino acid adenylation domain-containing protein [Saprospiraceae bacterium]|nr:amino acid adenylation domain-containing protein [Saprospiraceae bacterium]